MSLEVTGKLIQKYDTVQVSEKFKKREFVVELSEEINGNTYLNPAKMQLAQAKCDIIDRFNVGDMVKVSFNIKGNSYVDKKDGTTKYITNLDAWRVEAAGVAVASAKMTPNAGYNTEPISNNRTEPPAHNPLANGPVDDLPF